MKRAKKRFAIELRNDLGDWRNVGTFKKKIDAELTKKDYERNDYYEVHTGGYVDLHTEYRIVEKVVY